MKILMVAGLAQSLINFRGHLIAALQAHGYDVHVAAPFFSAQSNIRVKLQAMGVTVHEVPMNRTGINPLVDMHTAWALWRLMRRIRPDMVLTYTIKSVVYGSLAAWFAGVPKRFALITGLGYAFQNLNEFSALQAIAQTLYRISLFRVTLVFFQNPDDLILFQKLGLLRARTRVSVVHGSGVDLDRFQYRPLLADGRKDDSVKFLCIGRLLIDKGIREYVEAARIIRHRYPSTKFRLVGAIDSNPNSISQQELNAWVAEGTIEYLGELTDVRRAIEDCSVYVLPSYREGTPRTVLEAMSTGRAVITTNAPGCRETVRNCDNGFLVPIKSVDSLAEAMECFIRDPRLAQIMGRRGRGLAEEKYDVHKVNAVMLREMEIC
jgi:glycosyltransferase involved in cell wall biosynthesis